MTRAEYDKAAALLRMAYGGNATESNAMGRMVTTLTLYGISFDGAKTVAADLMDLAVQTTGFMTVVVHGDKHGQDVSFSLSISRDMDEQDSVPTGPL